MIMNYVATRSPIVTQNRDTDVPVRIHMRMYWNIFCASNESHDWRLKRIFIVENELQLKCFSLVN
jgi:hypothetical protein